MWRVLAFFQGAFVGLLGLLSLAAVVTALYWLSVLIMEQM
jgi:hypothetical protein